MNIHPLPAILILVISVASCASTNSREQNVELFRKLFSSSPVACSNKPDCFCIEWSTARESLLPLRYSRSQFCPTNVRDRFLVTNWDQQNRKVDEGHYTDGGMDGRWESWYPDGRKNGESLWIRGKQEGLNLAWHENGTKAEESYFENGLQEGRFTRWYDNGNVQVNGQYLHGKPDGVWIFYEKDGRVRFRKTSVRGKLVETDAGS
jgi:hypothetical protein